VSRHRTPRTSRQLHPPSRLPPIRTICDKCRPPKQRHMQRRRASCSSKPQPRLARTSARFSPRSVGVYPFKIIYHMVIPIRRRSKLTPPCSQDDSFGRHQPQARSGAGPTKRRWQRPGSGRRQCQPGRGPAGQEGRLLLSGCPCVVGRSSLSRSMDVPVPVHDGNSWRSFQVFGCGGACRLIFPLHGRIDPRVL
jgi:hypothetical protein